ncbi:MAG: neutral zinc metallopeptidase [Pseudomonadota bacterium]
MADRSNPMLGLVAAIGALIAVPVALNIYRAAQPRAAIGPEVMLAAAREVDRFWAENFDAQFPGAVSRYRTPAVRFDDVRTDREAAADDYAGYYRNRAQSIHVDLDPDRSPGYTLMVLGHEYGHHVQNLAGLHDQLQRRETFATLSTLRQLGVRYELQAECLAGVWAHHAAPRGDVITRADVRRWQTLNTLGGDLDTHGTARQRLQWFTRGYQEGQAAACDTFAPAWEAL